MSKFNICIIRPNGYIHSSAFIELAELICYSLIDNGMSAEIKENSISSSSVNIILGCHLLDLSMIESIPKNSIIFNTEQFGQGPDIWQQNLKFYLENFSSWDYSSQNIKLIQQQGVKSPILFEIGYHERLSRIAQNLKQKVDILFYGSLTEKRVKVLSDLERRGVRVKRVFGLYGAERDFWISRSKIVINLHAHATKIFEIIRVHYLMNNAKAVVCQVDEDTKADPRYLKGVVASKYDCLVDRCVELLDDRVKLKELEECSAASLREIDSKQIMANMLNNIKYAL
jgi:hypothetical protein